MTGPARAAPAPAKINLSLHVTGQRADGYHTLDSLVVFAGQDCADRVWIAPAADDGFAATGPFAPALDDVGPTDNLVIRARDWLRRHAAGRPMPPVRLCLDKRLPVASGIGGGSADAAAALTLLADHWGLGRGWLSARAAALATELGADVPMCVMGHALRAGGIGERLDAVAGVPALPVVLVNPGVAVSTPAAFAGLASRDNPAMPDMPTDGFSDAEALAAWLAARTRNDLQAPAGAVAPAVADVLAALTDTGALLARMSGSGATCFGIYDTVDAAGAALAGLERPGWWARATVLNAAATTEPERSALAHG